MLEVARNLNKFYADLNTTPAAALGGTQFGLSKDYKANQCGMQAVLDSFRVAHEPTIFPAQSFTPTGKPSVVGWRAGVAFHALQDLWTLGKLTWTPIPENLKDEDASLAAAVFAFRRYATENVGSPDFLGLRRTTEFPVQGVLAGVARTGRIDTVVDATEKHIERWAQWGIYDAAPGTYLWDYKLLATVSTDDVVDYQRDLQLMAYMLMYEQQTGSRPQGAVYELVSRANKTDMTRQLVLVPNLPENTRIVEWAVAEAEAAKGRGACNTSACRGTYRPCPHRGVCPLYGTYAQHAESLAHYTQHLATRHVGEEE